MITIEGASKEEMIMAFREIYQRLDHQAQTKELMRLNRVYNKKPVLFVEPLGESDRRFKFESVEHFVLWLRNNGFPSAEKSNVYKALRKERHSAYGYIVEQKEEEL